MSVLGWQWHQLVSPSTFFWKQGVTPFSEWYVLPAAIALYLATIFFLKKYATEQKLIHATGYHNLILCAWSLVMFLGLTWETMRKYERGGAEAIFCEKHTNSSGAFYYWIYIFYISKFYELLDTVILALKKKPMIFLHVYHHCIVVVLVWTWLEYSVTWAVIAAIFNTFVHVIMYYYYYISAFGQQPWWKKYITSLQIVQFVANLSASVFYFPYSVRWDEQGNFYCPCTGWYASIFGLTVNLSFLILFTQFYRATYNKKSKSA